MATDTPTNDPPVPHRSGGVSQTASSARSRPSGAQPQSTQEAQQALDQGADRILAAVKSHLEENKVPGIIKVLEKMLAPGYPINLRTRRRCFRGLVEVCGKYAILPDSHSIPESKIGVVGDGPISSGEFSEVWEGNYKENDETKHVAIKVVRYLSSGESRKLRKDFCREVIIWKRLSHENILQLIGATMEGGKYRMVSLWMENGNIVEFLKKNYETNPNPLKLLAEAARGVQYLHSLDLAHGDLKGRNILIGPGIRALLTDVGLTRITSDLLSISTATTTSTTSFAGDATIRWAPLELLDPERCGLKKRSGPTKKSDVYSMAMTIYEVLTDKIPFHECTDLNVFCEINRGARPKEPPFNITRGYTQELWDMGTVCWNPDPDKRLGIDNVLSTLEAAAEEWKPGSGSVALGPDPSGAQPQNMPPTLDETVNQILAEAGSPLGEGEARRLTEMLEKKLGSCHDMDLETRRRCFHRLVEMCGEHSILPNSCIIQESKLQKQDEIPVSSGGSSVVWRGMYTENDGDKRRDVAIRVIRYSSRSNDEEIRKDFCREAITWRCLSHPNILEFLGVTMEEKHSVVSPWMENGNVIQFLRKNPQANPLKLLADAARGLQYLHNMGLAHGDVEGRNILITDEESACLADFEHTRDVGDLDSLASSDAPRVRGLGTIRWCPLEILDPKGSGPTKGSDVYSMGVTIYEVLTDRIPIYEYIGPAAMFQIAQGERLKTPDFTITRGYTQELWDMGMSCWDADPTKRPTIDGVLNTLEIAAGRWKPKHEELHPLPPRDGHGTTVSEGEGSSHIPRPVARDRGPRSTPPDAQQQDVQGAQTSLDKAVDQILSKAKSLLKENEVLGVVKELEGMIESSMNARTRSRCFRELVEVCGKYGVLPASHTILGSKIETLEDVPVSAGEFTEVWPGTFMEDGADDGGDADDDGGDAGDATVVAIKVVRYLDPDKAQSSKRDFCREVITWKRLSHPNVLRLIGATIEGGEYRMVSPWMDKNIVEFLREDHEVKPNPLKLLADAARGLQYLHSIDLTHGDLRGRNIFITDEESACLADFGHTRDVGDPDSLASPGTSRVRGLGTIRWCPLEILDPKGPGPTKRSDIYSFAMAIYEVLTDRVPFYEYTDPVATLQIAQGQRPGKPNLSITRGYTQELWEMGVSCWDVDPAKRPTVDHILGTLGVAAGQSVPKHEGHSPSPLRNDLPPPVSQGGSIHRPETSISTAGNQDSTLDPVTPADEATDGQSGEEPESAPTRTRSPDGQQMGIMDHSRLESGIDHVLLTLEGTAGECKPKSGELSTLPHSNDRSTTIFQGASGHGPGISGSGALGPDPSGAQPQNTSPTLDDTVDQIPAEAKSPLGEGEAEGVIEALEMELKSYHDMDLETQRRCLQSLVKICGEHSILPDSCIIPEPKLQKQDEIPVSSGGSSVVWRGVYMQGNDDKRRDVAIKVMRYSGVSDVEAIRKDFCRETITWRCLSHPNISEFLGAMLEGEHSVVSPWMENGNIIQFLRKNPEANLLKLLADAARGLQYLHNMGLAHGDVEGRNILITDEGSACLTDFGHTQEVDDLDSIASSDTPRVRDFGTIRWCPLELLDPKGPGLSKKSDIYSMAMTIYEVLADRIPFYECAGPAATTQIAQGGRPNKPDFTTTRGYTQELWDMGMSCWDVDPAKRPMVGPVLNTLEIAAEQWKPNREGLSPPPLHDDLPPTVPPGSSHRPETSISTACNQDSALDPATPADEVTDGQPWKKLGSTPTRTSSSDGQRMDINDQYRPESVPVLPRPTKYGVCWGTPGLYDPMTSYW